MVDCFATGSVVRRRRKANSAPFLAVLKTDLPLHGKRIELRKHGFSRTATWLLPVLEQFLRFFDFGEILPRIEIDEHWREHL